MLVSGLPLQLEGKRPPGFSGRRPPPPLGGSLCFSGRTALPQGDSKYECAPADTHASGILLHDNRQPGTFAVRADCVLSASVAQENIAKNRT